MNTTNNSPKKILKYNASIFPHIFVFILLCSLCLSFGFGAPETNLVSHWGMEEGSGTSVADSVGTNDLSLNGAAWNGAPICGDESVEFDGSTTARDTSTTDMTNAEFSFNTWFRSASTNYGTSYGIAGEPRVTSNYAWYISTKTTDGAVLFNLFDGSNNPFASGTTNVFDTDWHMITVSVDATNLTIYIDGVREGSNPNTASPSIQNSFTIGAHPATLVSKLVGNISHATYWDRALTHAEISGIYQNESTGDCYPWQAGTIPSPTYNSTNYTLEFLQESVEGNSAVYSYLNTTCLETVTNSTCYVNLQGTINGVNHSFISDPTLVEHDLVFFVNANQSFYSQVGVQSINPSTGTFGYYGLNNNASASVNYTLKGALTNVNVTINPWFPDNDTITIALGGTCPFYETQSKSQFWIYMILAIVTILTIFTGFIFNSVLLMVITPFTSIYLAFASTSCDLFLAIMWVVICAVACLRLFYWGLNVLFLKKFKVN